jgi:hypothetical protein
MVSCPELDMPRQIGGWSFGLVTIATNTRLIVEIMPTSPPHLPALTLRYCNLRH